MKNVRLAALLVSGGLCSATSALAQPAAAPAEDDENLFRFYGMFNPRFVASSGAVESYSQPNAVAVTAAGNPVLSIAPDKPRYTFQVAQSRIGFWLNEKGPLRAQLEIDFVDFGKSTPTTGSLPRVRLARVDYSFAPGHTLSMGQDWDLHAPINPHGINLVGALFQAGNAGFMRQQLKYVYSAPELELGAALGFPTPNNSAKAASLEIGTLPTLAVRGAYKFGKSKVGASAIATRLPFNLGAEDERVSTAFSAALFSEFAPSADTHVRVELNYGQNAANLGLLTLAQGRHSEDLQEFGGLISARQVVASQHAVYGMAGYQKVVDASKVLPSYGYGAVPGNGTPPAFSSASLAGSGPGLVHNGTVRLGYEFRPTRKLAFMVEGFLFQSRFRLQQVDEGRVEPVRTSMGIEAGALLSF
ncbi:MAG TPA: hypothetical protein VLQ93_08420 [Myxococcaceae bacterium]|nr:hypothetical protein [Myxococcaceae bacterium]